MIQEAYERETADFTSWRTRALAHYRLEQSAESLAAMSRVQNGYTTQSRPLPVGDLLVLAMAQFQAGLEEQALASFQQISALDSVCPEIRLVLN